MAVKKKSKKIELTELVRQIGNEIHTTDDDGSPLTKLQVMARLIWKKALGYTEEDVKTGAKTVHFPDKGFIDRIWDRLEGKVQPAAKDSRKKASLADRITEQSKRRLSRMAKNADDS